MSDNAPALSKVLVRTRRIRRDSCRFQRKAAQRRLNPSEQHRIDQDQSQNTARAIAPSRRCASPVSPPAGACPLGPPSVHISPADISRNHFQPTPGFTSNIVLSRGVVPCRNSLDGNAIYFLNGLLLLMMPTIRIVRA